MESNFSG